MVASTDFVTVADIGANVIEDPQLDSTGKAYATSAVTVYGITVDNANNSSKVYLKLYDKATAATDSDDPDFVYPIPASTKMPIPLNGLVGYSLANGLSARCVTTGGTGGTTNPTNAVPVTVVTN